MASARTPSLLPAKDNKKKLNIDIPYNRWENRRRRAVRSFIRITLILSVISFLIIFARSGPVEQAMVLSGVNIAWDLILTVLAMLVGIVAQFGLIFWFLSRPKAEIIRPGDDQTVTFDDYWGQPELVKLVKQWMSLLRDRKDFEKMGGKYISGLLLYGPPGTGKTMLAKAVAGESGMAFISALGTSFQGMFWGMDILMILRFTKWARDLAKKYGACVAYIDEIDAIGMARGGVQTGGRMVGLGMGMGYGSFGLTTLLSQMDGVNAPSRADKIKAKIWRLFGQRYIAKRNWHVMWMGSTNRPDVLDPALTRSGRLDTKIHVAAPDRASRRQIVQGYLQKIKHDDTVDVEAIVADTNGMTPADISGAITKDAVRIAFFDGRRLVSQRDIDRAFMEQTVGQEMPIEEMEEEQRRVLAYHEASHAIAQYYVMPDQKIVRATIVQSSSGAKGYVMPIDTIDQHIEPVQRYVYDIIVSLAGRSGEKIYSGQIYNSVGGDYRNVQRKLWLLAMTGYFGPKMAMRYGIFGGESQMSAMATDETLEQFWIKMEDATERLLRRHWREVTALAEELLIKKTLSGKEVVAVIEANQTADSLNEDEIIPKTLAAIRAQTILDAGGTVGTKKREQLEQPNTIVTSDENVVIINGAGNGVFSSTPAPEPVKPEAKSGDKSGSGNAGDGAGPTLISDGQPGFQPPLINDGTAPPQPEQK